MRILHVEDNPGDSMLIKEAFSEINNECEILQARNGKEALNMIQAKEVEPNLILLDINMPVMNGKEFLKILKYQDDLLHIPVVVLSSSRAQTDVNECYRNHANSYINKGDSFDDYIQNANAILEYWNSKNVGPSIH